MGKSIRVTPFYLLTISVLMALASCGSSNNGATTYAFQMGKMTGSNPSYFRIALTLYQEVVDFPTSSSSFSDESTSSSSTSSVTTSVTSSESSSPSDTSSSTSEDTSSDSSSLNSYASSILALDYTRSFTFEYRSQFTKSSSSDTSSSEATTSSSEDTSSPVSTSTSGGAITDFLTDGISHLFHGLYAEDGDSNLYFQITIADNVTIPGYLLALFLKAKLYSDHVDVTIPVSITDGIKAILREDVTKYHTVTVGLNKE